MNRHLLMAVLGGIILFNLDASASSQVDPKDKTYINKVDQEISGQGYGRAGCGPGSIIFGERPGWTQVFAATTNAGTLQSAALTVGTSNCPSIDKSNQKQTALFLENNMQAIKKEAVRGGGESIRHVSFLLNCLDSGVLGAELQYHFIEIFEHENLSGEILRQRILEQVVMCRGES